MKEILSVMGDISTILAVVFYGAIVLWTYKDARRRIEDPILIATAVATSMLPVVGVFVYMLLRPPEYLADVRERELEIRAMERQLGRHERCPYCKSHIESDYLACPVCASKLRYSCVGCTKALDPRWAVCPYCETETPRRERQSRPGGNGGRDLDRPVARKTRDDAPRKGGGQTRRAPSSMDKETTDSGTPRPSGTKPSSGSDDPLRTEPFQQYRRMQSPATEGTQMLTPTPRRDI